MDQGHQHQWATTSVVLTATGSRISSTCTGCAETLTEESQADQRPPLPPPS